MRLRSKWFATSALLALTTLAMPSPSHAQAHAPRVDVLIPGPDGVLWLDQGDISQAYLDHLQRRQKVRRARAEQSRYAHRRFAQDVTPRPPGEISRTDGPRNDPPRVEAPLTESPKSDEAVSKLRDEVQRLSYDIAKMRSETDALRDTVGKLTSETAGLRGEIGALREVLAKRASEPAVTGKLSEPLRPSEPLRKQDSLKGSADEKFAERPPTSSEGIRKPDESYTDTIARAWRRVREMIGRPGT